MREKLISFETAKLAEEKGFNWSQKNKYFANGFLCLKDWLGEYNAPTQSFLQKWLREVHGIDIEVTVYTRPHYCVSIVDKYASINYVYNPDPIHEEHTRAFESFEKAMEAGLLEALKLIETENEDKV